MSTVKHTSAPTHAQQIPQAFSANGNYSSREVIFHYVTINLDRWTLSVVIISKVYSKGVQTQSPQSRMLTTAVYTLNYCDFLPSWPPGRIEFSLSQAERDIEREGESKYESERRRQSRKCTKKWKSLPSGPGSLVPLPSFYLMSLWRITLFARNSEEGDILSARWSQSTLYDRRAGC